MRSPPFELMMSQPTDEVTPYRLASAKTEWPIPIWSSVSGVCAIEQPCACSSSNSRAVVPFACTTTSSGPSRSAAARRLRP